MFMFIYIYIYFTCSAHTHREGRRKGEGEGEGDVHSSFHKKSKNFKKREGIGRFFFTFKRLHIAAAPGV